MKKIILLALLICVLTLTVVSAEIQNVTNCLDPTGDDPLVKGAVTYTLDNGTWDREDGCWLGFNNRVLEWSCSGNNVTELIINCDDIVGPGSTCSDGVCVAAPTCVDADCFPYVCAPNDQCYTSCKDNTQCDSSAACSKAGTCERDGNRNGVADIDEQPKVTACRSNEDCWERLDKTYVCNEKTFRCEQIPARAPTTTTRPAFRRAAELDTGPNLTWLWVLVAVVTILIVLVSIVLYRRSH